jgi:hypothetical protein
MEHAVFAQATQFERQQTLYAIPKDRGDLPGLIGALGFRKDHPLIVLIGGHIHPEHADLTHSILRSVARTAQELGAMILSGGNHTGVLGPIGQIRAMENYDFPLVSVVPQEMPTWPGGPTIRQYLRQEDRRFDLASYYSHFILVPEGRYGNEAAWIVDLAEELAPRETSISVLVNGVNVTRKEIQLNLQAKRKILALAGTSRLTNEFAIQPMRDPLIRVIPAADTDILARTLRMELGWK